LTQRKSTGKATGKLAVLIMIKYSWCTQVYQCTLYDASPRRTAVSIEGKKFVLLLVDAINKTVVFLILQSRLVGFTPKPFLLIATKRCCIPWRKEGFSGMWEV
jgi:hypothetical protein